MNWDWLKVSAMTLPFVPALCVRASAQAPAAPDTANFAFTIPWDDVTSGTATDLSFLNAKPAGVNGRIIVKDGHFVESETSRRIRFLGTNMALAQNFPTHEEAEKIAAHLAKSGMNVVRLHHLDYTGGLAKGNGSTLIDGRQADRQHLHPENLERLDYLIAQFKKNGIYLNVNLKVSRSLTPADGMPDSITKVPYTHQKRLDRFNKRWIELQKKYARDLLTHVNPYTGMSLIDDPAVMTVEINNENSIIWSYDARDLAQLPEPFKGDLRKLWNQWLLARYEGEDALRNAWSKGAGNLEESILTSANSWKKQNLLGALSELQVVPVTDTARRSAPDIRVNVLKAGDADWHVEAQMPALTLENQRTYTLSFRAKAQTQHQIRVGLYDDRDFHNCGLDARVNIGSEWKTYSYAFSAYDTTAKHVRISFALGAAAGTVDLADVQLMPGGPVLQDGESLRDQTIEIARPGTVQRHRDWMDFLAALDLQYATEMRSFLIHDLGVKAPIVDSQVDYGGVTGLYREKDMDFVDTHQYWQHPTFGKKNWDRQNWTIENSSATAALSEGSRKSSLYLLAGRRVVGKPFTISEFDHPAPNDYVVEMMPMIAAFGALQDWDAIYTFCCGPYGESVKTPGINNFFDQTNHPGKIGFYPAAAMIFRQALISPAPARMTLRLPEHAWYQVYGIQDAWNKVMADREMGMIFNHRVAVDPQNVPEDQPISKIVEPASPTENSAMNVSADGILTANSSQCAVIVGLIANRTSASGALEVQMQDMPFNFGAVTLVAMDDRPVSESSRMLLTIGSHFVNNQMKWNADRTSIGSQWGVGPVMAAALRGHVTCQIVGTRNVYRLDATGKRQSQLSATSDGGRLSFDIHPDDKTMYYEIVRE